jgi:hypothetical protein
MGGSGSCKSWKQQCRDREYLNEHFGDVKERIVLRMTKKKKKRAGGVLKV